MRLGGIDDRGVAAAAAHVNASENGGPVSSTTHGCGDDDGLVHPARATQRRRACPQRAHGTAGSGRGRTAHNCDQSATKTVARARSSSHTLAERRHQRHAHEATFPLHLAAFCRLPRAAPSAPDRIRTCDLRFRRPTLYPAELRAQTDQSSESGEGGIRTRDGGFRPILAYSTQRLSSTPSAARKRCKSVTSPSALAGDPADLAPSVASIRASMRARRFARRRSSKCAR